MSDLVTTVGANNSEIQNAVKMDESGNLGLLGMQIKISDIIGDKLVDQFMATITPDQMDAITKVLFDTVFNNVVKEEWSEENNGYRKINSVEFKTKTYNKNYYGYNNEKETPIYERAKATLKSKYSTMVEEKVKEYLESEEYHQKAEAIAKEIVDYAIEGYKEDIIKGIRERLVLPVVNPVSFGDSMRAIINDELSEAMRRESNNYTY